MAEWVTVLALIAGGLALIIVEIIFVPGTTIVGVVGFLAGIFGIYLSFEYFGSEIGWWVTGGSLVLFVITLYYSFQSDTWDKFSLKDTISSKVNEGMTLELSVGDEGIAISTIKPVGKADFNEKEYEVRSTDTYIESGTGVRITKININNIFVEPII